jgi:hypothetical protein
MNFITDRKRSNLNEFGCITYYPDHYVGGAKLTPASNWFYCWVHAQKTEARGKGVYLLRSEKSAPDYLTESPHNCIIDDANAMAFEKATKIIRGRDAVEKFLAIGIWPLSDSWDFEVERTESPLSKVTVVMPKVTAIIAEWETGAAFEARIALVANKLIGNYGSAEHRIGTSQLNHVFELAGVSY